MVLQDVSRGHGQGQVIAALRRPALSAATWAYARIRSGESPRPGLRILTYHAVGTPIEGDVRHLYNMPPARFETHMRYLAQNHAGRLVSLGTLPPSDGTLKIAVTFDDGYRDNLLIAAPLMAKLGIPFTVFACTGAVAGRRAGFLGPEEVRELAGVPGAAIGSHTVGHPRLAECGESTVNTELADSKAYLEDLLGTRVDSIAFPHGSVNRRVRDLAESAGYRTAVSTRFDINRPGRDPLLLCRTDIWSEDDIAVFDQKLRGDWDWNRWRSRDPQACA